MTENPSLPASQDRPQDGRAARKRISRRALGAWEPPAGRRDPVAILEDQGADRVAELLPIRYQRMGANPFSFYRGAAAIMAADLGSREHTDLTVQLCGDAHLANFGGFATPDRQLIFDLNDFDETLPGPFEWDVARLVASFQIAAEHKNFSAKQARMLVELVARSYVRAMGELAPRSRMDVWYTRLAADEILKRWGDQADAAQVARFTKLLAKGQQRTSSRAVSRYTRVAEDGSLHLLSAPPLVVPLDQLRVSLQVGDTRAFLADVQRGYAASLSPDRAHLLGGYEMVDAARKVVGVGSVGTRCFIGLLTALDDPGDDLVLQYKQAQASVYESVLPASRFDNHGRRVVEGQRLVQAASDVLLGWTRIEAPGTGAADFYVRQMWDWKTSADLDTMDLPAFRLYAQICGWTLARAHARSGPRKAIAAYLGSGDGFAAAMVDFAASYAAQNASDYKALQAALASGRITAESPPAEGQRVDL